ncbi:MAG: hypothetical protein Q8P34_06625 [Bacteroidota bacterium]|nr:hypothetical protein [Bacteroidota bacterium]
MPIKYAKIPPIYDRAAIINKNNQGVTDFALQAIKSSGGSNPKKVSEIKKVKKTEVVEKVSTTVFSNALKSKKKYSNTTNTATNRSITSPPLIAVLFKKS